MQHIHPNIQQDIGPWQRICEYDKRAAEVPFTPVLSKKQKQKLKEAQFLGNRCIKSVLEGTPLQLLNEYFLLECARYW